MKNKFYFLLTIICVTIFIQCTKANPEACLTVPATGKVGTSITFTSCSLNAHHEEWDFGDAATSTGSTVTHAYNKAGTFTVKLTALNEDKSKSDSKTSSITISQ